MPSVLLALYSYSQSEPPRRAFGLEVDAVMLTDIYFGMISEFRFAAQQNKAFAARNSVFNIQAGSAGVLYEAFTIGSGEIFGPVRDRFPDEVVSISRGPAEIIDGKGLYRGRIAHPGAQ
jgi:hypothetical protein